MNRRGFPVVQQGFAIGGNVICRCDLACAVADTFIDTICLHQHFSSGFNHGRSTGRIFPAFTFRAQENRPGFGIGMQTSKGAMGQNKYVIACRNIT